METFLTTLLILLLVYFGLKILFRLAMPFLMRYIAKKAAQKMEKAFGGNTFNTENQRKKEGQNTLHNFNKQTTKNKKPVGEYVDYEEID